MGEGTRRVAGAMMRHGSLLALALAAFLGGSVALAQTAPDAPQQKYRPFSKNDRKIVGGRLADLKEVPWQVGLVHRLQKPLEGLFCGGSLVASRWVLTAAHCLFDDSDRKIRANEIDVIIATEDLGAVALRVGVIQIVPHPEYDVASKTNDHDLALLQIESPAPLDMVIPLATDKTEGALIKWRGDPTVTGWGKTETDVISQRLLRTSVPYMTLTDCNAAGRYDGIVTDNMLCAGAPGRDACKGDSGGPLVKADDKAVFYQLGVVSWGWACGEPNHPGVYTRVAKHFPWIKSHAAGVLDKREPANSNPIRWSSTMNKLWEMKTIAEAQLAAFIQTQQAGGYVITKDQASVRRSTD